MSIRLKLFYFMNNQMPNQLLYSDNIHHSKNRKIRKRKKKERNT